MSWRRWGPALMSLVAFVLFGLTVVASYLPAIGAGGLLHPARVRVLVATPSGCRNVLLAGDGLTLKGWECPAHGARRATLVYLHGVGDNRASATGLIEHFSRRGFDVVAYDSRSQGDSEGEVCTYGYFEKDDLHRVLDTVAPGPIVLMGSSLGAAVALQEAAHDPRVTAIVAAETFSDLRTVATERAPFFFTPDILARAFAIAEQEGRFRMDAVAPVVAASVVTIPVLLIHGAEDVDTVPDHSRRILAALAGPKRLILVPGARHNESLSGAVWVEIDKWLDDVLGGARSQT
jgi:uncharacterized protein